MTSLPGLARRVTPCNAVGVSTLAAVTVGALTRPVSDPDTWWHLWSGQWMLTHGRVLREDLLSFTSAGKPYLPHSWLSEVLMALPVEAFGLRGLLLFRSLLLLAVYGSLAAVVVRRVPQTGRMLGWGLVVLAAFAGAASWAARPYLFSYLLVVATLDLMGRRGWPRWLLVPLFAVWSNLHGLWLLGLGLLALRAGTDALSDGDRASSWMRIGLAVAAITLLNPFGWHLHAQLIGLTTGMQELQVLEWRPTDFTEPTHWAWLGLVGVSVGLLWRDRGRVRPFDWVVMAVAIGLGIIAVRNLPVSAIMLAFVAAGHIPVVEKHVRDSPSMAPAFALAGTLVALSVVMIARFPSTGTLTAVAGDNLPSALVWELEPGRVFTVDGWGGIVSYARWPDVLVAYDTRIDFHGPEAFGQYWDLVLARDESLRWLRQHCVAQVLGLSTWPMVEELKQAADWHVVGHQPLPDGRSAVLLRDGAGCQGVGTDGPRVTHGSGPGSLFGAWLGP